MKKTLMMRYLQLTMASEHVCQSSGKSFRFIGQESVSDTLIEQTFFKFIKMEVFFLEMYSPD